MTGLFPIPDTWAWTTLGEIADVVGGVTKDSKKQHDPSLPLVPYLRVANVQRGHLDLSKITEIRVPKRTLEKLRLQVGDVLLNEGGDRDKIGRGWVWNGEIPDCIHQNHVFRARLEPGILEPRLLAWYSNECARNWFEKNATQSVNLASISLSKIKQLPVPIAPLTEQHHLVATLETYLSRLREAQNTLESTLKRLRILAKRIIVEAVPIPGPSDWKTVPVGEAGKVELGRQRHPTWHTGPNMRPYLRVANVFEDRIDTSDLMEMDFPPDIFDKFRLKEGDILLNEGQSPEYLGRPAIYRGEPGEVAFTNSLLRFTCGPDVIPEWALLVFRRHMHARRFIQEVRITTNIAHLSAGRLKSVEFPIPPITKQQQIVSETRERLDKIDLLSQSLSRALARASSLRTSLLTRAFSGNLTGQNSADESVSVLLDRIKADRVLPSLRTESERKTPTRTQYARKAPPQKEKLL